MSDNAYLDALQRQKPPLRSGLRAGQAGGSAGGVQPRSPIVAAPPGYTGTTDAPGGTRYVGTRQDVNIRRARMPWYHREYKSPVGDGWVDWTAAGPIRPELHMMNSTGRLMQGNSESRFPVVDTPTTGMHTNPPSLPAGQQTGQRYRKTRQMTSVRIFRLSPGQYAGQTYSQTTQIQGA